MLSVDIDEEDYAQSLLSEMCEIWLSVRGHSLTRCWMKTYKRSKKKGIKKSKALRKDLKKKEEKKDEKSSERRNHKEKNVRLKIRQILQKKDG